MAQRGLQHLGVHGVAQGHDAIELGARRRQRPSPRAGGQDQLVVVDHPAVVQADHLGEAVDLHRLLVQAQVDLVFGIEALGLQHQRVGVGLPLQPGLGQRRALIGGDDLFPDQSDGPRKAVLAQERRHRAARMAGPNDHHMRAGFAHSILLQKNDAAVNLMPVLAAL